MEPCLIYEPSHDKKTGCTFIRRDRSKCCTTSTSSTNARPLFSGRANMCPFRTLFYLNGHNWLASKLLSANISYGTDRADR